MAFVDSPHYAWVMSYLWGMKNFFVSLGTVEVFNPSHRPKQQLYPSHPNYVELWEPVFNGLSGPYILLSLTFNNVLTTPPYYAGNHARVICDGEEVWEDPYSGLSGIFDLDDTRYIGRDGVYAPFFFAQDSMLIETRPIWSGDSSGEIECVIMRFSE